jgi:thiol-disulfide isomerase/thioredoxin
VRRILIFSLCLLGSSIHAQSPKVVQWPELEQMMKPASDALMVINFWATWCKPCVAELPSFIRLAEEYNSRKVRFVFVSLDFKKELDARLVPFVKDKMPGKTVVLLDEPDHDTWISKVDEMWQGAIPATLFVRSSPPLHVFYESSFTFDQLSETLKSLLKE